MAVELAGDGDGGRVRTLSSTMQVVYFVGVADNLIFLGSLLSEYTGNGDGGGDE